MSFNSWRDFEIFVDKVKYENRFLFANSVHAFLKNVEETLPNRERRLPQGEILYRSQIGNDETDYQGQKIVTGYSKTRMKPILQRASEGRANPKGIPYLYLSNCDNTSMSELRPHIGQNISLARFKMARDIRLVDCYSVKKHYEYYQCIFSPPESKQDIEYAIWSMINNAFSRPINNNESNSDYVPTQIITELFKSAGFDGICYKSTIGKGHNFTLFDTELANFIDCIVMETESALFKYKECERQIKPH